MPLTKQQLILASGIILVVALGGFLLYQGLKPDAAKNISLTVWGVDDDKNIWDSLTKQYVQETGNKIVYVRKNASTYERELIDALASGLGPDIFYFHNTWFLKHYQKIVAAPKTIATSKTIEENYPAAVSRDFVSSGQVIGLPLYLDSLALLYNPALLDQAAIPFPPKTWEELTTMMPKLTKFDSRKNILYSGAALGTSNNIEHAADLVMLLMMQAGSPMVNARSLKADLGANPAAALKFYTQFADSQTAAYTWTNTMANSLDEFARGKVAFVFAYAKDISYIKSIAPYLNFKIALMPQPEKATLRKDFANYWGLAVSRQSSHATEAWNLIAKVTNDQQAQWYSQKTNLSPAKKSIIPMFRNDLVLDVYTRQAYTAANLPQPDNQNIQTLFAEVIDNLVRNRTTPQNAAEYLESQINRMFDAI